MIYVASSWRNRRQPEVVQALRAAGHEVYDFREDGFGFGWAEIDLDWQNWTARDVYEALSHPLTDEGFQNDMDALEACDTLVLVMPCGRSAHLELGHAIGAGKRTVVLLDDAEPELMWKAVDHLCLTLDEALQALARRALLAVEPKNNESGAAPDGPKPEAGRPKANQGAPHPNREARDPSGVIGEPEPEQEGVEEENGDDCRCPEPGGSRYRCIIVRTNGKSGMGAECGCTCHPPSTHEAEPDTGEGEP